MNATTSTSSGPSASRSSRRRSNVVSSCDLVAEHRARMRLERDDGRAKAGRASGLDHGAMAEVDAVEGADRDRPLGRLELVDRRARRSREHRLRPDQLSVPVADRHELAVLDERRRAPRRSPRPAGRSRPGALSSRSARGAGGATRPRAAGRTRSVVGVLDPERTDRGAPERRQWPPSASAIART